MSLLRDIFWFERGEAGNIWRKITSRKFEYETIWESEVLLALIVGVAFAFQYSSWGGLMYMVLAKWAIQALNRKRFFDPEEPEE